MAEVVQIQIESSSEAVEVVPVVGEQITIQDSITVETVLVVADAVEDSFLVMVTQTVEEVAVTINNVIEEVAVFVTDVIEQIIVIAGELQDTFETFSKNLRSYNFTIEYTDNRVTKLIYTSPVGIIEKLLTYNAQNELTAITLSGAIPLGVALQKTITYENGKLKTITYS